MCLQNKLPPPGGHFINARSNMQQLYVIVCIRNLVDGMAGRRQIGSWEYLAILEYRDTNREYNFCLKKPLLRILIVPTNV
jgi:hypothetical protein